MKTITGIFVLLLLTASCVGFVQAVELPEIDGVFGLNVITSQTYLAVWVPVDTGAVITGVQWYQNDGNTVFPEILAAAGLLDWPGEISDAVPLVQDVGGQTLFWSEATFPQPITANSAGLYLFFRLQEGDAFQYEGSGGGFGLGHYAGDGVRSCWLTGNGVDWSPMDSNYRMAVEPILMLDKAVGDALVLKLSGVSNTQLEKQPVSLTATLAAYPNPFNPQTEIKFVVPQDGLVQLGVYDLRGHRVRELVSSNMVAGEYSATWDGRSENGQQVASGIYFARFTTGNLVLSKQLVLLK